MTTVKGSSNWNVSTINKFFNTILSINKNTESIPSDNTDIKTELSNITTNTNDISDIATSTGLLAGSEGFVRHGVSVVTNVSYKALVVQEDTVFSAFFVNGVDVLSARGMSGVTFSQGAYLPGGLDITGFTITSGSVIAY